MSHFAEQEDYLSSLSLSEEELLQMVMQDSLKDEKLRQEEILATTRALKLEQDREYMESLAIDSQKNAIDLDDAKDEDGEDYDFDLDNEKDDKPNDDPKEGDQKALREARIKYFLNN
jgi:hypothetical protein